MASLKRSREEDGGEFFAVEGKRERRVSGENEAAGCTFQ